MVGNSPFNVFMVFIFVEFILLFNGTIIRSQQLAHWYTHIILYRHRHWSPNWLLRDFARVLCNPVCATHRYRTGLVPIQWKMANVTMIPKVNSPKSIDCDLRPISPISTISKLLEAKIGNWILDAISDKVDVKQFGAIKGRSTTQALTDLLHQWHSTLDNGGSVKILFVDYAKAFDHVDQSIVCRRLLNLGTSRKLVIWIHSFLTDRKQHVKVGSTISGWLTLNGGIPEGSRLRPLCFLIMINNLKLPLPVSTFVDDTTITELVARTIM